MSDYLLSAADVADVANADDPNADTRPAWVDIDWVPSGDVTFAEELSRDADDAPGLTCTDLGSVGGGGNHLVRVTGPLGVLVHDLEDNGYDLDAVQVYVVND